MQSQNTSNECGTPIKFTQEYIDSAFDEVETKCVPYEPLQANVEDNGLLFTVADTSDLSDLGDTCNGDPPFNGTVSWLFIPFFSFLFFQVF